MTREDAIDELSVLYERCINARQFPNKFYCSLTDGQYIGALDMAIEALKDKETREQYEKWEAIEEEEAREYFEGRKQPNAPQRDNGVLERAKMQEPCEDCISRQAVNALVDELARAISDERCCVSRGRATSTIMQDILDLPPVTPQPKMGEWLKNGELCKCSRCGSNVLFSAVKLYNYCYRCGAKMEVKE